MSITIEAIVPQRAFIMWSKAGKYIRDRLISNKTRDNQQKKMRSSKEGVIYVDIDNFLNGEVGKKFLKEMMSLNEARDR